MKSNYKMEDSSMQNKEKVIAVHKFHNNPPVTNDYDELFRIETSKDNPNNNTIENKCKNKHKDNVVGRSISHDLNREKQYNSYIRQYVHKYGSLNDKEKNTTSRGVVANDLNTTQCTCEGVNEYNERKDCKEGHSEIPETSSRNGPSTSAKMRSKSTFVERETTRKLQDTPKSAKQNENRTNCTNTKEYSEEEEMRRQMYREQILKQFQTIGNALRSNRANADRECNRPPITTVDNDAQDQQSRYVTPESCTSPQRSEDVMPPANNIAPTKSRKECSNQISTVTVDKSNTTTNIGEHRMQKISNKKCSGYEIIAKTRSNKPIFDYEIRYRRYKHRKSEINKCANHKSKGDQVVFVPKRDRCEEMPMTSASTSTSPKSKPAGKLAIKRYRYRYISK